MNWDLISKDGKHYLTCNGDITGDGFDDLAHAERVLARFTGPTTLTKVTGVMDNRHRNWKRRG